LLDGQRTGRRAQRDDRAFEAIFDAIAVLIDGGRVRQLRRNARSGRRLEQRGRRHGTGFERALLRIPARKRAERQKNQRSPAPPRRAPQSEPGPHRGHAP
jgi:hypothetical protein